MGKLTAEMHRLVYEQRLGYVATVCPDGTPNLSPKGTIAVWDDDHLIFADICSPRTVRNLRANPAIEINVVDPISRQGFRFKGTGVVLDRGPEFDRLLAFYRDGPEADRRVSSPIRSVVRVTVERVLPLISPAYLAPVTEAQVRERWSRYYAEVMRRRESDAVQP